MSRQPDRRAEIAAFLAGANWPDARRQPLAGDASARRYVRLCREEGSAVLMDAPPGSDAETAAFLSIARHLRDRGLSAPEILAADPARGLVLMEDLGDALFARLVGQSPVLETRLYAAAADLLAALHRQPPPEGLPVHDAACLGTQATLVLESYAPAPEVARRELAAAVTDACRRLAPGGPVLELRDFHAGNLIWLPARAGVARVGLLDFQDAMAGHPAYDLVSLLRDARRDVGPAAAAAATDRYLAATGADAQWLADACAALGAARQLRILGVFAGLARSRGKAGYLRHMPRVWRHLQGDLAHPGLAELRTVVAHWVPEPTPARLEALA